MGSSKEEEVWVHRRGLDIEIEESVQFCQKKMVIFDVMDAPKGNMAIRVRDYESVSPDRELGQKDENEEDLVESEDSPRQ